MDTDFSVQGETCLKLTRGDPNSTDTVSIAIGREAEKIWYLSQSKQHILTVTKRQTDMIHGASSAEKDKDGHISETALGDTQ